jgi:hypothetical protein
MLRQIKFSTYQADSSRARNNPIAILLDDEQTSFLLPRPASIQYREMNSTAASVQHSADETLPIAMGSVGDEAERFDIP